MTEEEFVTELAVRTRLSGDHAKRALEMMRLNGLRGLHALTFEGLTKEQFISELATRTGLHRDQAGRIYDGLMLLGWRGLDTLLTATITTIMVQRDIMPALSSHEEEEGEAAAAQGSRRQ